MFLILSGMTNPSKKSIVVSDQLYNYILEKGVREHPVVRKLRARTAEHALGGMQMTPDQGALFRLLLRLTSAHRVIEVGSYTGTGTLEMALALPEYGYILACETRKDFTEIGIPFWEEAGVREKIDIRIGPAAETLREAVEAGWRSTFDFAFIDADKENYGIYYEYCLELVKPGGLLCIDNVLWMGSVVDPADRRPTTEAIRALNNTVAADGRVEICMLGIADGMTLVRKKTVEGAYSEDSDFD
jgi:predicted O-methyltransferase YrrM